MAKNMSKDKPIIGWAAVDKTHGFNWERNQTIEIFKEIPKYPFVYHKIQKVKIIPIK